MAQDARRFDLVAETQIILDGEVAGGWELVRGGIRRGLLGPGDLRGLIDGLAAGGPVALGALAFEPDAGGDRLRIALDAEQRACPRAGMLEELERLERRAGALITAAPAAAPTTAVARAGAPVASVPAGAGEGEALDLLEAIARVLGTTPAQLAGDPAAYQAQVDRVRVAVTRLRDVSADPGADAGARDAAQAELRAVLTATGEETAATAAARIRDLPAATRALGVDTDQLARVARAIADWLEQRTPAAGAVVDRVIATLEIAAAPIFADGESPAARQQRLREEARSSISASVSASVSASLADRNKPPSS